MNCSDCKRLGWGNTFPLQPLVDVNVAAIASHVKNREETNQQVPKGVDGEFLQNKPIFSRY
jgi:hypothetical protein